MKKEASGKKNKWLWLVLGVVALLAVAGVVLALVFGGEKTAESARPDLYWNVDRQANVNPDTGLSIREPAEDGNFYIRFAHNGEQIELPVADKKLVNYIDGLDVMSLVLDKAGFIVDIFQVKEVAMVIGEGMYVQTTGTNSITINSAITMNGRKLVVPVSEDLKIYNVSGRGEFIGAEVQATELNAMDSVSVYAAMQPEDSEEDPVITHIFVTKQPAKSPVYWRANRYYASKKTTRVPDENGVYTIPFFVDGESVELKCKDVALVTEIDAADRYYCHFGLELDEDGYIIEVMDSFIGSRTLLQCERYDITALDSEGNYTATSLIKNDGSEVEGTIGEDCPIYDVSYAADAEHQLNRKVKSLQKGDRVCIWTDTLGNPVLVYVVARLVDSPAYWNVTRMYDSTNKTTSRTPNADGYYEIELLKAGSTKKEIYYFKTEADATEVDYTTDRCVGLKVGEGNIVEYAYNMECVFGYGYFCRGYYASDVSAVVCSFLSNAGSGYTMNGVLSSDCKVWNVSTVGTYGEATTLQYGDSVYAAKNPKGEIVSAYVTRRTLGMDTMYWRLSDRMYDSEKKVSTREPDAEGYYVYTFSHGGKLVDLKTKDKKIADYLDSLTTPAASLVVKNGIIQSAHDVLYACGGFAYRGWYVKEISDTSLTIYNKKGREEIWDLAENWKAVNVSNSFVEYKGEKTDLKLEDYVYVYFDIPSDIAYLFVWGREAKKIAWPVAPQYDSGSASTTREPDADGWYHVDLFVDGKIQSYKTKNKAIMSSIDSHITAFGIETSGDVIKHYTTVAYVEKVQGAGLSNYTVTSVSGNTVNAVSTLGAEKDLGTKKSIVLASNVKIYDVSADAENRGAPAKIQAGDKIFTYTAEEGEKDTLYVYIVAHNNRSGGYLALCDHCNKVVYWNPFHGAANVSAYDAHYYLASDVEMFSQLRVYSTARDFETVLDLNGHTLTRNGSRAALVRYGDTLTILDSVGGGKIETTGLCSMGAVFMVSDGVINMHGGTLHHVNGDDPAKYSYAGGLVYANTGAVFNMYDGTLLNGQAFADKTHEAYGGAMRIVGSTVNIYGGTITGGKANSYTYTTDAGKTSTKSSFGGNIYAEKESTINVYGGVIESGNAGNRGGNIYAVTKSVVNISGGKIIGGVVGDRGGNIFSTDAIINISGGEVLDGMTTDRFGGNIMAQGVDGQLNISGGKISGGKTGDVKNTMGGNIGVMYSNVTVSGGEITNGTATLGGNISLSENAGKASTLTVSGGTVSGGNIYASSPLSTIAVSGGKLDCETNIGKIGSLTVSGKPVITNLKLGETVLLKVNKMQQGADVTVNAIGTFTEPGATDYAQYFKAFDTERLIGTNTDGSLRVYHPDEILAFCDHCEKEISWTPWDGKAEMSGHYYVKDDMTLTDYVYVKSGYNLILNLNGKTVTAADQKRAFSVYGNLYVMDTAGGGAITKGVAVAGRGGNVYVENGTFTLYSGSITDGVAEASYGGNVYVTGAGTVNIKGGSVSGGTGSSADNVFAMYSTLNISGGEIIGSNTGAVPNVAAMGYSEKVAYVNISGGKLTGSAKNLSVTGNLAELTISGGELDGISNVSKVAKFELSGAPVIKDLQLGEATVANVGELATGADIIVHKPGVFTTAFASKEAAEAALAYFTPYGAEDTLGVTAENALEVIGKPVVIKSIMCESCEEVVEFSSWNGTEFVASGHYFLEKDVNLTTEVLIPADMDITLDLNGFALNAAAGSRVFNLEGQLTVQDSSVAETGKIVGAEVAKEGATIYVNKSIFNLYSGTITGGTASGKYGGNFCVLGNAARVNLYGGVVSEGTATRGGNFYIYSGKVTISGDAQVVDGTAVAAGTNTGRAGNIYVTGQNAYVTITENAVVSRGEAATDGGNIYAMYAKNVTVSGNATVSDGVASTDSGNMYISGTAASGATTLDIAGGTISNGAVFLGADSIVNVSGGNMNCVVAASSIATMTVSGAPVMTNVKLSDNEVLTVDALTTGANIVVNKLGTFTEAFANKEAAEAAMAYFTPYDTEATLGVTAENALEVIPKPSTSKNIKCEECGQTVEFTSWDGAAFTASGHYFLAENVTLAEEILVPGDLNVVLDLNGFELRAASGARAFNVDEGAKLSVQDSSTEKTGRIIGSTVAKEGATIYVYKSTFNLYGGTITGGTATGKYGGNFCMAGGVARINLYGGTVSEGTATRGGNFYIYSGKLTISGDAQVVDGTAVVDGTNTGRAGNIYVTGQYAYVTVTDNAVISGGEAGTDGGNIYAMYAKNVAISGNATVSNGAANVAGNMYISGTTSSGKTTLDITGGTIVNGSVLLGADSIVNVSGGNVDCIVTVDSISTMTVSGAPKFTNLILNNNEVLTLGELTTGASIKLDMTAGVITDTLADATAAEQYFSTVAAGYKVQANADNKLEIVEDSTGGNPGTDPNPPATSPCPHCTEAVWTPWDGSTVTSGHYYLTQNVDITNAELAVVAGEDVIIDLRGNTITATDVRAFSVKGILSIVDTVGEGKIVGNGPVAANTSGGVFSVSGGGLLNLYSGELSMAAVNNGAMRGGVVYVSTNSTFHMYGGAVRNGVADGDSSSTSDLDKYGRGGNICNLQGTLILEGGVIDGGKSGYAGNIYNGGAGSSTTISGTVVISNGTAVSQNAGNLYLERGVLNISGGTMTGGKAAGMGDNILMSNATQAELTITGGTLEGVTRLGSLTKFAISGNPVIENMLMGNATKITELGTLTSGASIGVSKVADATTLAFTDVLSNAAAVVDYFHATDATKAVVVDAEGKLTFAEACPCGCGDLLSEVTWVDPMTFLTNTGAFTATTSHCYITEDAHLRLNANFNVTEAFGKAKQLIVGRTSDAAKIVIDLNGFTWSSNHRLYVEAGSEVTIMDTSAAGTGMMTSTGNEGAHGRTIINNGVLNLYGGTFTMTEENAPTVAKGGVIYQSKGTFNLYGGIITGGKVDGDALGGNVSVNAGTFNMFGGTISNGEAVKGGNVYMAASTTFNLSGGTITGGAAQEGDDAYLATSNTKGSVLNASGGTVNGEVCVPNALSSVTVSGDVKIGNLNLQGEALVTIGELFETAKIGVSKATAFTDVLVNAESYLTIFTGAGEFDTVTVTADGKLIVAEGCPCGCGALASEVTWVDPMTFLTESGAIAATTTHAYILDDVHLRLTENFDVTTAFGKAKQIIVGKSADPAKVVVDLNGFTWSSNNRFYVEAGSEATVLDTSATGTGVMTSTGNGNAGRVICNYGIFNLRSGTLTVTTEGLVDTAKGGVVYQSKGTFNMYGGTITGGKVTGDSLGGNVAINAGTFNLNGGTISNGDAINGDNIYLGKTVTFNNNGGTVIGETGDDTLGIYRAS